MGDSDINPKFIGRIDESKRSWIRRMVIGTAFTVPTVASFSLNGLGINDAHAQSYASNASF